MVLNAPRCMYLGVGKLGAQLLCHYRLLKARCIRFISLQLQCKHLGVFPRLRPFNYALEFLCLYLIHLFILPLFIYIPCSTSSLFVCHRENFHYLYSNCRQSTGPSLKTPAIVGRLSTCTHLSRNGRQTRQFLSAW